MLKDGGTLRDVHRTQQVCAGLKISKKHLLETIPPNFHFSPAGLGQPGYKGTAQPPAGRLQGTQGTGFGVSRLGFKSISGAYQLLELGMVTRPLYLSFLDCIIGVKVLPGIIMESKADNSQKAFSTVPKT